MRLKHSQLILIVEDSDDDYAATLRAFNKAGLANTIERCSNGDQALDYLFRRGQYAGTEAEHPGIVLLDLNLPGTDGRDILRQIKADEDLKKIPVVVLTTSDAEIDIESCYAAGANSYIQKPVDLVGFMQSITRLKEYWFEVVILPKVDE